MESLERFRGHFYNWYDTISLKPLSPLYVSTVDSGNLAALLITLSHGLRELPDQKMVSTQVLRGLIDTLDVLKEQGAGILQSRLRFGEHLPGSWRRGATHSHRGEGHERLFQG